MALNERIHTVFDGLAVFRIDHYLGKERVQNLLYFRFANSFLEPIWNRHHVASVQINMPKTFDDPGPGRERPSPLRTERRRALREDGP